MADETPQFGTPRRTGRLPPRSAGPAPACRRRPASGLPCEPQTDSRPTARRGRRDLRYQRHLVHLAGARQEDLGVRAGDRGACPGVATRPRPASPHPQPGRPAPPRRARRTPTMRFPGCSGWSTRPHRTSLPSTTCISTTSYGTRLTGGSGMTRRLLPADRRNLLWMMFSDSENRARMVRWEPAARAVLSQFRSAACQRPDDPRFAAIAAQLTEASPEFRRWWAEYPVRDFRPATIGVDHPEIGRLSLEMFQFRPVEHPECSWSCRYPGPGMISSGSPRCSAPRSRH